MDVLYRLSYLGLRHKRILAEFTYTFNLYIKTLYTPSMEGLAHYEKEERPWGNFERFTLNEKTTVKIVSVNAGESISLQTHEHRDEFWHVIKGSGVIRIGDKNNDAKEGDNFFSPRHSEHRVTGGPGGLAFLEIAFGDFDANDITRLEDRYGRA